MSATRRTTIFTVTDDNTGATVTGDVYDIEDTIRGWFPDAPEEVAEAIDEFMLFLRDPRPSYTEAGTYLGLTVA